MTGLTHLLRDLEELKRDSTPGNGGRADELLQKITYATWQDVDLSYQLAEGDGIEGADTVSVDREIDGDTAIISAQGEQVLFVEFGTGINRNEGSVSDVAGQYGFSPATWSMSHSKWLLPPRSIMFKGKWPIPGTFGQGTKIIQTKNGPKEVKSNLWTEGHPAIDAMYHAFERLVNSYYPDKAKEIYK